MKPLSRKAYAVQKQKELTGNIKAQEAWARWAKQKFINRNEIRSRSPAVFFRKNPKIEHMLYKQLGNVGNPITDVTLESTQNYVFPDYAKIHELYLKGGKKQYANIHNHPITIKNLAKPRKNSLPSHGDLYHFLINDEEKVKAIYQHNPKTNEIGALPL